MAHILKATRFQPLNTWELYPGESLLGFPELLPQTFELPDPVPLLHRYRRRAPRKMKAMSICHGFAFDYVLEPIWNRPLTALRHVLGYWGACTPDFSLYANWPIVLQQWNVYRSRWVGRFWQEAGLRVIPTVNWSTELSWAWCFRGIPLHSIVALAGPAKRDIEALKAFRQGFVVMQDAILPRRILVYGELPFPCDLAIQYPADFQELPKVSKFRGVV